MTNGRLLLAPLALIAVGGCATLFTGTNDELTFNANVHGVRLTIDGQPKGTLPITVTQSRDFMHGQEFRVKLEAQGYETQQFQLKRQFNWVAILDITSVPTSGGIDYYTGALMHFEPKEYHIQMVKKGKGAAQLEREKRVWRYTLINYRRIQSDLARGGGEHLESFAQAVGGEAGSAVAEHTLRNARPLLEASGPHEFVFRFNQALERQPDLSAYRI